VGRAGPVEFATAIDIAASPERVWEVMSDIDQWREWTPSIRSVTRLGDKPFAVGTRVWIRQPKLPPALWKIISIDPDRGFTWVSAAPGLLVTARHGVEPAPAGARASLFLSIEGRFRAVLAGLTGKITKRYLDLEAEGLKARSLDPSYRHSSAPAGAPAA
jgi:uncharacterized membrane protein